MSHIAKRRPSRRTTRAGAALAPALVAGLIGAGPALAADAPFRAAPDLALASLTSPRTVAAGDFDSDGRQDLAVADEGRNSVQIRLGKGDGTFREAPEVTGLIGARDVVVADFDGDGHEDLAVAARRGQSDDAATVLRGTGDGGFTARSWFELPSRSVATSLAVGDFDGNAVADLAATGERYVSVRLGTGTGSFAGGHDVPVVNQEPGQVVTGDFDGDGREDAAVALAGTQDEIAVYPGVGDGRLGPPKRAPLPGIVRSLAVGDFDEDGAADVLAPDPVTGRVGVRLGTGDGSLRDDPTGVAVGAAVDVAVADFDGDGHEDFASADALTGVSLRLGAGDGTFRDGGRLALDGGAFELAAGDVDGDGAADLFASTLAKAAVAVRLGTSPPALAGNLLVNGGFDQGPGARLPAQGPAIPGWTTTGGTTALRYGAVPHRGVPTWIDAARWSGARNLLWGGDGTASGGITTATQTVDVAGSAGEVDAGRATARLSAELGGALKVPDTMTATAEFLNAAGAALGSVTAGPVTVAQRRNQTTLLRRDGRAPVPAGTRRIRVALRSEAIEGGVSSALADNVKLTLDLAPGQPGTGVDGQPGGSAADSVAPALGRVTLSPARFAVARRATAVAAAARRGTTVRYSLSEPAAVTLRIDRLVKGKRRTAGTLRRTGATGANRVRFSGRIGRKALARGRYRLTVRATDAAGNRSAARTSTFRVVR